MSDGMLVLVAVGLLLANVFFVAAEFALISARRTTIEPRVRAGSRPARMTLSAMENVSLMMAGGPAGHHHRLPGSGIAGPPAVAHLIEGPFEAAGMPEDLLHPVAFVIAMVIVVFLHVVIGEMAPRRISPWPARIARPWSSRRFWWSWSGCCSRCCGCSTRPPTWCCERSG